MTGKPEIPMTLIIPVHDRQDALDCALQSVIAQEVVPAEVIVVDDASETPMLIRPEFTRQLRLRLIRHDRNKGAAGARNTGLAASTTEWITFLDSDDALLSNTLGRRWALVQEDQQQRPNDTAIYGCGWIDCDEDGKSLGIRQPRPSHDPLDFAAGCWFSPGSCIIMNGKRAVEAAGGQDETLRRFEDCDWFLALALKGFSLQVLPVIGANIERKRQQNPHRIEQAAGALCRKWAENGLDRLLMSRLRSYMSLETAAAHFFAGSRVKALLWLARSLIECPRFSLQLSPGWDREKV
ncbi:Glycosyl transferase family 2 [Mesorhizobium sp. YR577]|nr:Glycosyl transferase family 2 [Mesorhizobium sp. YR577]